MTVSVLTPVVLLFKCQWKWKYANDYQKFQCQWLLKRLWLIIPCILHKNCILFYNH